jgi:hypothetical protein
VGWNLIKDHMESCLTTPTLELEACLKKDLPRDHPGIDQGFKPGLTV